MKLSDYVSSYLVQKGAKDIFAIVGAGNVHLLDSVACREGLNYICPHHEQAGVMAAIAYHRISKNPGIMLTTGGPGAANAVIGVLDAWADSIPCMLISGQEKTQYVEEHKNLRMWGVQGFNVTKTVEGFTKYAALVTDPNTIRYHLDKAFYLMNNGRPGPVWLDIPIDVQAANIDPETLQGFLPDFEEDKLFDTEIETLLNAFKTAERPLFIIGHGVHLSGGRHLMPELLKRFPVPFLTAWNGKDLIASDHQQNFGHEGNYGQRCANFIVQNCDLLVTIGTRLAIPQVGYNFSEFARSAKKFILDIDQTELSKFAGYPDVTLIKGDAKQFIEQLLRATKNTKFAKPDKWLNTCNHWKEKYPPVDPKIHTSKKGFVNSYRFVYRLSDFFRDDEVIVTDMGTSLTCTHQAIVLRKRQRIVTSTGLGEMGFGLPGAIGACFANNKNRVILIVGDGSFMMNLQELQTVIHHRLPIKIFLYTNDAYLTIKHTQKGMVKGRFSGTNKESGVSCPDFIRVAKAFGFETFKISDEKDIDTTVQEVLNTDQPALCEVVMEPLQELIPKLSFSIDKDGKMVSPPIEDLYPFLPRQEMKDEMIIDLLQSSIDISV
jgi:acetolactate synthase-1/2/3 large subunit